MYSSRVVESLELILLALHHGVTTLKEAFSMHSPYIEHEEYGYAWFCHCTSSLYTNQNYIFP